MTQPNTVTFDTGASRSADADATRYDLISPIGLRRLAKTYAEGAEKYGEGNWLKGFPASNLVNHLQKHIEQFKSGDTTEDHLAHAAWGLFTLMHFQETSRSELFTSLVFRNLAWLDGGTLETGPIIAATSPLGSSEGTPWQAGPVPVFGIYRFRRIGDTSDGFESTAYPTTNAAGFEWQPVDLSPPPVLAVPPVKGSPKWNSGPIPEAAWYWARVSASDTDRTTLHHYDRNAFNHRTDVVWYRACGVSEFDANVAPPPPDRSDLWRYNKPIPKAGAYWIADPEDEKDRGTLTYFHGASPCPHGLSWAAVEYGQPAAVARREAA